MGDFAHRIWKGTKLEDKSTSDILEYLLDESFWVGFILGVGLVLCILALALG